MRFVLAILVLALAIIIIPERAPSGTMQETIYPSHTCPEGHAWYEVTSDSDSITVACYTPEEDQEHK